MQKLLSDQALLYLPSTTARFEARIAEATACRAPLIKENKLELDRWGNETRNGGPRAAALV